MTKYVFSNGKVSVVHDVILEPEPRRLHVLRPGIIVFNTTAFASPELKQKKPNEQHKCRQEEVI